MDVQQNRLAEETQGDEGAAKLQEGQMNVGAVLVADLQAPERVMRHVWDIEGHVHFTAETSETGASEALEEVVVGNGTNT